jgi:hypothetical protein
MVQESVKPYSFPTKCVLVFYVAASGLYWGGSWIGFNIFILFMNSRKRTVGVEWARSECISGFATLGSEQERHKSRIKFLTHWRHNTDNNQTCSEEVPEVKYEDVWGSGGTSPRIGTRWRWVVSLTVVKGRWYPVDRRPVGWAPVSVWTLWMQRRLGGWARVGLDAAENRLSAYSQSVHWIASSRVKCDTLLSETAYISEQRNYVPHTTTSQLPGHRRPKMW